MNSWWYGMGNSTATQGAENGITDGKIGTRKHKKRKIGYLTTVWISLVRTMMNSARCVYKAIITCPAK